MKSWRGILAFLAIILWIGAASAESTLNLSLPGGKHRLGLITVESAIGTRLGQDGIPSDRCYGTAHILFGHSAHPGGDLGGRLNQNNGGYGGRCYLNREKSFYGNISALHNSQYGNTLVVAAGRRWAVVELDTQWLDTIHIPVAKMRFFIGLEGGAIYYERRFGRGAVTAPFIFPNIAGSIHIGKVEITAMQIYLIDGIRLWGHVFEVPAEALVHSSTPYNQHGYEPTSTQRRGQFHPTVFIRYSF